MPIGGRKLLTFDAEIFELSTIFEKFDKSLLNTYISFLFLIPGSSSTIGFPYQRGKFLMGF